MLRTHTINKIMEKTKFIGIGGIKDTFKLNKIWGEFIVQEVGQSIEGQGWHAVVVYNPENNTSYGSAWPLWAYNIAKDCLLYSRKMELYYSIDPFGDNILHAYVTSTSV